MTTRKARTKKAAPEPAPTRPAQIEPPRQFSSAAEALAPALSDAEWLPLFVEWLAQACDRLDAVDVGQLSAADAAAWAVPIEAAAGRIRKFATHKLRGRAG